jgi:hypothetical protein
MNDEISFDDENDAGIDGEGTSELAISKNYFDFEGIGSIDGNIEVVDEIKAFVLV